MKATIIDKVTAIFWGAEKKIFIDFNKLSDFIVGGITFAF
jgi:hypothetical protein